MKIEIKIPDLEEIYCSYDEYDSLTGKDLKKIIADIAIEKFINKMYDNYVDDKTYYSIRDDVKEAIETCINNAGVRVIIVTGDTPGTANEIGRQITTLRRGKKKYMWNEAVFKENKMLRMKVLAKKAFQDSGVR